MEIHDFALAIVAFVSEFLGTLSGYGSSTLFMPLALLFEQAQFVLALTGILHCFGNLAKILLFRKAFNLQAFILLSIPFVAFCGMGALLVAHFGTGAMLRILGFFLIAYGLFSFVGGARRIQVPSTVAVGLSALSGFSTGFIGTGGAIRGMALNTLHLSKESFVAVSASIDMGGDLLRTAIYLRNGFMNWDQWFYIPILGCAAYLGTRSGRWFLQRIDQLQFEKTVAVFILASGIAMLI